MKRNLYKLVMASVGALALGIQTPTQAADLNAGGDVPKMSYVSFTSGTLDLPESAANRNISGTNNTLTISSNDTGADMKVALSAVTIPATASIDITVTSPAVAGEMTQFSHTFSSIETTGSEAAGGTGGELTAGADFTSSITVTVTNNTSTSQLVQGEYTIPLVLTIANS